MSYSYFVADLRCPACEKTSEATIVTKVESEPGTVIRVGDRLDVTVVDMQHSHYTVRLPGPDEPLRILEPWSCPTCGSPTWVEIVIEAGHVHSMTVTPFDVTALDRVHFVANRLAEFYEEQTGEPLHVGNGIRPDWLDRLRGSLAPSGTP